MKKKLLRTLLCLLVLCAAGCNAARTEVPAPTEHTLRFFADGALLAEYRVAENEQAVPPTVADSEDRHFAGWDRTPAPATADADYTAVFLPKLSRHVPYLFRADDGLLHPDALFTGRDAALALRALAPETVRPQITGLPDADSPVSVGTLRAILAQFYFETDFPETALPDDHALTRAEAAALLNPLLGRSDETVSAYGGGFADAAPGRRDYAVLMEAAAHHTPGDTPWEDVLLPTNLLPGTVLDSGRMRRIDAAGYIVRDTVTEDGFAFNAEGWYTSGDDALDAYVTETLAAFQAEAPDADAETLLRMSFNYVRDSFAYLRKDAYAMGTTGWETDDALEMFASGRGNCYNYAAAFWALARGLGYDARAVSGTISKTSQPHGWVEIDFDGETYYFDTETEMAYLRKQQYGYDMFKMPWSRAATWSYREIN